MEQCFRSKKSHAIAKELKRRRTRIIKFIGRKEYKRVLELLNDACSGFVMPKNEYDRYKCTTPYDSTVSEFYGIPYINASFISINNEIYVACQNPKIEYQDKFIDFINKTQPRCILALIGNAKYLGGLPVLSSATLELDGIDFIRDQIVDFGNVLTRVLTCLHWKDGQALPARHMKFLHHHVSQNLQKNLSRPVVVHCEAGVGRTGTFIMYDTMMKEKGRITAEKFADALIHLRAQRPMMIESEAQLRFLAESFIQTN